MVLTDVGSPKLGVGRALWALAALAALASGCIKRPAVVRVPEPQRVAIAIVVDHEASTSSEAPQGLKDELARVLAERNLVPEFVPFSSYSESFGRARDSARRYAQLQKLAGDAPLLLLVENRVQFFSHLNGRFRWNVNAKASAGRSSAAVQPVSGNVDIGAILQFNHEKEPEALTNVAPTIADHVGVLFDSFLMVPELDLPATGAPAPAPSPAAKPEAAPATPPGASTAAPTEMGPIYFVMVDRFANGNSANDGAVAPKDPQGFMVAISRE